jgi:filamentous hemagglutinin family protein
MAMADAQRDVNMKLPALVRHRRAALLVSTALCATGTMLVTPRVAAQPAANAQPTGGVVVGGSVSIGHSANQTTINQSTQRGAIDWQTFNVGSRQSVQFNQPSSTSMTLNKVQGSNPSQIAGQINANGQIIIQNQSGVVFYQGSQVNTAGLMVSAATSSATATQAFLSGGKLVMDQAANPNAAVVNQGQITVKQAGLAALVAPQVVNSGVITARLGRVELAGGSRAALDLYGDGMLSIDVTGKVAQLPNGATALVTNSGVIVADGGTVRLTARAADGLVTTLVDAGGKIQANSVGSHVGTITLNGVGGSIRVEGQLDATGNTPGTTGGNIAVNPTGNVTVASGARIDASGQAGGGLVAIGTTLKRAAGGPSVTATHIAAGVSVQPNATIAANATVKGNGGRVTLLSTTSTDMAGAISAKGGPQGGNGGFVEVSGDKAFALTGMVDVSAPFGLPGTILLDPFDLTVIDAGLTIGTENSNFIQNGGTVFANDGLTGTPDTISNAVINSFQGNVELQAKNNLEVAGSITLFGGSLTLRAGNNLTIDTGIAIATNGGNVLFTAADKTIAGFNPAGSLTFNGTLTTTGTSYASVTMSAGTGGIILNGDITAGLLDLSATGAGVQQIGGTISVSNLQSSGGVVGTVSLTGGNFVGDIGGFSVTPPTPSGTADFLLNDLAQLFVSGPLTAPSGNVFLSSADPYGIVMVGPVTASGRVSLQTDSLSSDGGVVTAGTFELAPFTLNSELTLGSIGSGLSLDSLSGSGPAINAGLLRFGAVTLPGATSPTTTAGTITVGGTFDAQTLPVELDSLGAITEAAAPLINVSTLSGNGGVWTLDNTGNSIDALGNIAATSFTLIDNIGLAVNGALLGGTNVAITPNGTLGIAGTISGSAIDLTASSIGMTGLVTDGGSGTTNLVATSGAINETGTLIAGTLTGSAATTANLSGSGTSPNRIATLGNFSANGFTLTDGIGLAVHGHADRQRGDHGGPDRVQHFPQPDRQAGQLQQRDRFHIDRRHRPHGKRRAVRRGGRHHQHKRHLGDPRRDQRRLDQPLGVQHRYHRRRQRQRAHEPCRHLRRDQRDRHPDRGHVDRQRGNDGEPDRLQHIPQPDPHARQLQRGWFHTDRRHRSRGQRRAVRRDERDHQRKRRPGDPRHDQWQRDQPLGVQHRHHRRGHRRGQRPHQPCRHLRRD